MELGLKASAISKSSISLLHPEFWRQCQHILSTAVQKLGSASSPRVWHHMPVFSRRPLSSKLNSLSLFLQMKRVLHPLLGFRPIIRSLSPSFTLSGDSFGLLYWPLYTPFFTHPVTESKHLLAFILTWICYFGREELTYSPYSSFNGQSLTAC